MAATDTASPPAAIPTTALADCESTFRRWLHLPDTGALAVTLAAVAANRGPGDPLWLLVVGPPGSGKTETLGPLSNQPDCHPTATLTEAALLSGTPKKEHEAGAKGGLLRDIGEFGIILCKDFGSVLSMHRDARSAVLAALREIYDGSWTRHVGTGGGRKLDWSGKVGLVGACTPTIDAHHAVMSSLGERFAIYRLPPVDDDAQASAALAHVGRERQMRSDLAAAVAEVLAAVDVDQLTADADEATRARLVSLATLAVKCRSAVDRDGYSREIEMIPPSEAPGRLALVLLRLLNGLHAIGVDDATAWELTAKVALDSMPALRLSVLTAICAAPSPVATGDLAEQLGYPMTTTRRTLEDLTAHGVTHRARTGKADLWHASDWTLGRWPLTVPEKSGAAR